MPDIARSAASSHPGQRSHNEDAWLCDDERGLYIVADGVGGREAGEIASQLACRIIADENAADRSLTESIVAAHEAIRTQADDPQESGRHGMACTAVVLRLHNGQFELAWSGDSRAYFWDGQQLRCLTRDHSLVEALIDRGELTRQRASDHPQKNVILSALGGEAKAPRPDSAQGPVPGPGRFLLCSDGLSDMLSPATLCELLEQTQDLQECSQALTDAARDAGGSDNITALLVQLESGASPESLAANEIYSVSTGESIWPRDNATVPIPKKKRPLAQTRAMEEEPASQASPATSLSRHPPSPGDGHRRWIKSALLLLLVLGAAAVLYVQLGTQ